MNHLKFKCTGFFKVFTQYEYALILRRSVCVSVFYDSIRYVAIDDVSYREKRILWET
jgi:hypothetical protein